MEKQIDHAGLNDNYKRNAEHKFNVLGLVTNNQHCDEHSDTAAKCGEQKQGLFGDAELDPVFLGYLFVVNTNDYRYQRNYCQVSEYDRKPGVITDKFGHVKSFL